MSDDAYRHQWRDLLSVWVDLVSARLPGKPGDLHCHQSAPVGHDEHAHSEIGLLTAIDTRNRGSATQYRASCFSVMELGFG